MPTWLCSDCGTRYRVRLYTCPRCKGTDITGENPMPKITRLGGPTNQPGFVETTPPPQGELVMEPDELEVPPGEEGEITSDGSGEALPPMEEHEGEGLESPAPTERPSIAASKAEWLGWAQVVAPDTEDLDLRTKAQLIKIVDTAEKVTD